MRRSAIGCKSSDGGEESGQRIHVFDRRIRAEGKTCTITDNITESVEQLHTFLALRAEDKRRRITHASHGHTSRSSAKCMSLILTRATQSVIRGIRGMKLAHAWVGWTLAMTGLWPRINARSGDALGCNYIPPSLARRAISECVMIWACSRRGRRAVTLMPSRADSNASRTRVFALSPTAWTFWKRRMTLGERERCNTTYWLPAIS